MMSVKVKICGITTPAQAIHAQEAGADAIGVVLYRKSSRYASLDQACAIRSVLQPDVAMVALFVNAGTNEVNSVIEQLSPDLLQFHGDETVNFCQQFDYPFIRAVRMQEGLDPVKITCGYKPSGGFLFDSWHAEQYGGTGAMFDWSRLPVVRDYPLILAGGLNCENVAFAVRSVFPDMVDVSGGVESAPGIKDPALVEKFICNAKRVN
jgi:phosphoribosylanthranilate isomerase